MTAEERVSTWAATYGVSIKALEIDCPGAWDGLIAMIKDDREECAEALEAIESYGDADGVRWTIPGHNCSGWGCSEVAHLAEVIRARQ